MVQVLEILNLLLGFLMAYNHYKAHNMLAIMLDLCYKNMKCIQNFVGMLLLLKLLQNMTLRLYVLFWQLMKLIFILGELCQLMM